MHHSAPRLDIDPSVDPIGYHDFRRDLSVNFQCNRWVQWIGPEAIPDVAELARHCSTYPQWVDGFLALAATARTEGRDVAAAYYDRGADFFMLADDPRRPAARQRFLDTMRTTYGVVPELVGYEGGALPCYDLQGDVDQSRGTIVVFGGYDSYIEEFFPMIATVLDQGYRVIAFDGPGQGGALEEHGLAMTHEWERPVAAILDHCDASDVTAIGVSLGGGLVIRAAAYEPRIARVVSLDILDDEFEVLARQIGPGVAPALRVLLALRARRLINAIAKRAAARRPISEWGLRQGLHITGTRDAYDFIRSTRKFTTRHISDRVHADVLLAAGADDHYVPLHQLHRQAARLTNARSLTTRTFTAVEHASNHCQIGNIALCVREFESWLTLRD